MTATTRIYLVKSADGSERHLVRAALPAQAVRHISGQRYKAALPSQEELIDLAIAGAKIQVADADDEAALVTK